MKKRILFLLLAGCMFSGTINALTLTDVGGADEFIAKTNTLANSGNAEKTWMCNEITGTTCSASDVTNLNLGETETSDENWTALSDLYYYTLDATGINIDYFLVKFGDGNGTSVDYEQILYRNIGDLNFLVLNLSDVFDDTIVSQPKFTISHYRFTTGSQVPEPSSIALLAFGLVGLGLSRRKKAAL